MKPTIIFRPKAKASLSKPLPTPKPKKAAPAKKGIVRLPSDPVKALAHIRAQRAASMRKYRAKLAQNKSAAGLA